MSAKPNFARPGTPNAKASPATPRFSGRSNRGASISNADSASPVQNARISAEDHSPKFIASKPETPQRRSLLNPPDKNPTRTLKPSELHAELNRAQEDLKKSLEKLSIAEKEKEKALNELTEAKKLSRESNEKLVDALLAKKRAEESSEIEKFRAVELEQLNIEEAQKKEEQWLKEIEAVRNQQAADVSSLLSVSEELQRAKQEILMMCDAKNKAMNHAEDATRLAEINAEKVESLSSELFRLKSVLETEAVEKNNYVSELKTERESLRQQIHISKAFEERLAENKVVLEELNVDLEAANMAESYLRSVVEESHEEAEEAKRMERFSSESLASAIEKLEGSNDLLQEAETEVAALKEKVGLLEIAVSQLEESERKLSLSEEEASRFGKKIESLMSEIEAAREEKARVSEKEKISAERVQILSEERNKLVNELENSRHEEEKSKKVLESLESVSSEARETKEKLLSVEIERESYEKKIEEMEIVMKRSEESYESKVRDSKREIDSLTCSIQILKQECEKLKSESEDKEIQLMDSVKRFEEDKSVMENEIAELIRVMKSAEEEARASKHEFESEVIYLKKFLYEAEAEGMSFKEGKENELRNVLLENEELRRREAISREKVEELSKLLEEALGKKENDEVSENEKDCGFLPEAVESSGRNETGNSETALNEELPPEEKNLQENCEDDDESFQRASETTKSNGKNEKQKEIDYSTEADLKTWESFNADEKELTRDRERESTQDEPEQKAENPSAESESINNGEISPPAKENISHKKKKEKPLLRKFGSLLKKKKKKSPAKS